MDCNRLSQWLKLEVFKDHKGGRVTHLCIRHIANGKLGSEILDIEVPENADDSWISSIVPDIEAHAEMDAGGLGGLQAYCILTYRTKSEASTGRHTFRVAVEEDLGDEPLTSEGPNKTGLVSQAMRHTEAMMRYTNVAIGNVVSTQSRTIERLAMENEALLKQHARVYETLEELQSQKHERDLDIRKAELREKVTEGIVEKVGLLLPSVVNRVLGSKALPEKTTPLEESIKRFMHSLTEEQMLTLAQVLSPEQKIALGMLAQGFDNQDNVEAGTNGNGSHGETRQ